MDAFHSVVTPIPQLHHNLQPPSHPKTALGDRGTEPDEKQDNSATVKIDIPVFPSTLSLRRNSAFSIYDPSQDAEQEREAPAHIEWSESRPSSQVPSRRTWRREKKDKREMNRLETKNLNRYFRSKINEMLRDVKENPNTLEEQAKATEILEVLNKSNKIMFSEIRDIIKDKWLQRKLTSCSAGLLKYIHGGKMGMQSKLIMLKYFNKILRAIRTPQDFTCWK